MYRSAELAIIVTNAVYFMHNNACHQPRFESKLYTLKLDKMVLMLVYDTLSAMVYLSGVRISTHIPVNFYTQICHGELTLVIVT